MTDKQFAFSVVMAFSTLGLLVGGIASDQQWMVALGVSTAVIGMIWTILLKPKV